MKIFAYFAKSFEKVTWKSAGVKPLTSPPLRAETFDATQLEGAQLLYFDLHGQPGAPFWMGDDEIIALRAEQIARLDLRGAVVFALSCYLADAGSPMMDAFLDAGARYVIGGDGENYASSSSADYGAALLGYWFRRLVDIGADPLRALAIAKRRVGIGPGLAKDDTLQFRAYYRKV